MTPKNVRQLELVLELDCQLATNSNTVGYDILPDLVTYNGIAIGSI